MLTHFFLKLFPQRPDETPEEKKRRISKAILLVIGGVYVPTAIAFAYIYFFK